MLQLVCCYELLAINLNLIHNPEIVVLSCFCLFVDFFCAFCFVGLTVPGVPAQVVGVQQAMTAAVQLPLPTACIMLLNMFDPTK